MPFPMKIQPIDFNLPEEIVRRPPKSRLKRLFERQFPKSSVAEKATGAVVELPALSRGGSGEFEPSSVCLAKMVQNFIEDNNSEKQRCGRNHCSCFNGDSPESSDDDWDSLGGRFCGSKPSSSAEVCEILKSLAPCMSVCERNLLADTAKIIEKNKNCKRKDDLCRKIVVHGLLDLGYDASICKSRWEKSSSCPAGEYEYVDVIIKGERLFIDIDFRSEFEIARPTKTYKLMLQTLPYIFVGKADRLQKIILIVSEAAKQSLKKRGMHVPPWRKAEYIKAKWLSPHARADQNPNPYPAGSDDGIAEKPPVVQATEEETVLGESVFDLSDFSVEDEKVTSAIKIWKPPGV